LYVLVLDEMNLAHVERYFADILSGMESQEPCLPNLAQDEQGRWIKQSNQDLPFPSNLILFGTVNVDETTYAFSPKVLDRSFAIEFRVPTDSLRASTPAPIGGDERSSSDFLGLVRQSLVATEEGVTALKLVHALLAKARLEFGHRTFHEGLRLLALLTGTGASLDEALDAFVIGKVLPRVQGSRRGLEGPLNELLAFSQGQVLGTPRLPLSTRKLEEMRQRLVETQYTSF
jgi:hypothetical protein